jgi:hypothetical protein
LLWTLVMTTRWILLILGFYFQSLWYLLRYKVEKLIPMFIVIKNNLFFTLHWVWLFPKVMWWCTCLSCYYWTNIVYCLLYYTYNSDNCVRCLSYHSNMAQIINTFRHCRKQSTTDETKSQDCTLHFYVHRIFKKNHQT